MTQRELADLVLTPIQEEAAESPGPPWAIPVGGDVLEGAFAANRVGDTLHLTELATGKTFRILVEESPS